MIITISRQYGAGGSEVARRVADALDWRLVDNQVVEQVAARAGLPQEEVAWREERAPGFIERLARTLTKSAPELFPAPSEEVPDLKEAKLVKVTEAVVAELAAQGRVVMVGRAAPVVLSRQQDALHVKLVASKSWRIQVVMQRLGVGRKEAERTVSESDGNRMRYHEQHYQRDWDDPVHYHMVLNTGLLGFDGVTAVVVGRAKSMWPSRTRERRAEGG